MNDDIDWYIREAAPAQIAADLNAAGFKLYSGVGESVASKTEHKTTSSNTSVWVVIQYDVFSWSSYIVQPGYWSKEQAEKEVEHLKQKELDSYSYHVKEIKMTPTLL